MKYMILLLIILASFTDQGMTSTDDPLQQNYLQEEICTDDTRHEEVSNVAINAYVPTLHTQNQNLVMLENQSAFLHATEYGSIINLIPTLLIAYRPAQVTSTVNYKQVKPRRLLFPYYELKDDQQGNWKITAHASIPSVSYNLIISHTKDHPGITIDLQAHYQADLLVYTEQLLFTTSSQIHGYVYDRAYHRLEIQQESFHDNLSPQLIQLVKGNTEWWLQPTKNIQAIRVKPGKQQSLIIIAELDHAKNHPFPIYEKCITESKLKEPELDLDETPRKAGQLQSSQITLLTGSIIPVFKGRYLPPYQAAISFVDHADQSDTEKLEAFAFGRTGAIKAGEIGPQYPGFVNRGLTYTKTIFLEHSSRSKRSGPQFDTIEYRQLLDTMAHKGVEIGVHSPSPKRDKPEKSLPMLQAFRKNYSGQTWVDHQPDTNCEAISNRGWNPFSSWFMLDNLTATHFSNIAYMKDVSLHKGSLNLFHPNHPARRCPIIYPHSRLQATNGNVFNVFTSTWFYISRRKLKRWLSHEAIQKLISEKGTLIGHVYFDTYRPQGIHRSRSLISQTAPQQYQLRLGVDHIFKRLASYQNQQDLWITTLNDLANQFNSVRNTSISYENDGSITIQRTTATNTNISSMAIIVPKRLQTLYFNQIPLVCHSFNKLFNQCTLPWQPKQTSGTLLAVDVFGEKQLLAEPVPIPLKHPQSNDRHMEIPLQ